MTASGFQRRWKIFFQESVQHSNELLLLVVSSLSSSSSSSSSSSRGKPTRVGRGGIVSGLLVSFLWIVLFAWSCVIQMIPRQQYFVEDETSEDDCDDDDEEEEEEEESDSDGQDGGSNQKYRNNKKSSPRLSTTSRTRRRCRTDTAFPTVVDVKTVLSLLVSDVAWKTFQRICTKRKSRNRAIYSIAALFVAVLLAKVFHVFVLQDDSAMERETFHLFWQALRKQQQFRQHSTTTATATTPFPTTTKFNDTTNASFIRNSPIHPTTPPLFHYYMSDAINNNNNNGASTTSSSSATSATPRTITIPAPSIRPTVTLEQGKWIPQPATTDPNKLQQQQPLSLATLTVDPQHQQQSQTIKAHLHVTVRPQQQQHQQQQQHDINNLPQQQQNYWNGRPSLQHFMAEPEKYHARLYLDGQEVSSLVMAATTITTTEQQVL